MRKHRVLFITPPVMRQDTNLPGWVEKLRQRQQPLGLAVVASQLMHAMSDSVDVDILDFYSETASTTSRVFNALKETHAGNPIAILGISCSSFLLQQVYQLVRRLKSDPQFSDMKIVLGGTSASYYHDELARWGLLDAIFVRNGNLSFLEYVKYALFSGPLPREGAFVLKDGRYEGALPSDSFLVESVRREVPIQYALFRDMYGFRREGRLAAVFTSYGCPYNCSFCSEAKSARHYLCDGFNGFRDIEIIRRELESLKSLAYDRITIVNDSLLNEANRWSEVADIIKETGMEFEIRVRVDQLLAVGAEGIKQLIDRGLRRVFVGVESASDEALTFLNKRINSEQIAKAFSYLTEGKEYHRRLGLSGEFATVAYIMLGLMKRKPDGALVPESFLDMLRSIRLPFQLKSDYAHYAALVLYPGTSLYGTWLREDARRKDYWQRYYENPEIPDALPSYQHGIRGSLGASLAYLLFYSRPRFWSMILSEYFGR